MSYNRYNDYAYPDYHQRGHTGSGPPPRGHSPSVSSENSEDSYRARGLKQERDRERDRVRGNYGKVSLFMGLILLFNGMFQLWKQKQNRDRAQQRGMRNDDRHDRRRRRDDERRRYGDRQYEDWRERAAQPRLDAPYGYTNGYDGGPRGQVRSIEAPPPGWREQDTRDSQGGGWDGGDRPRKEWRRRSDY